VARHAWDAACES